MAAAPGGAPRSDGPGAAASACRWPRPRWLTAIRCTRSNSTPSTRARSSMRCRRSCRASIGWAERDGGVSGERLLRAVVVAVDVAATLGLCSRAPMRFFRPANCSGFGAVAALAMLARLDETQTRDALGIYYGQCCGTMQAHEEASPQLAMQMGFAARSAVTAIELAKRGMPGPRAPISGSFGYFALFDGAGRPGAVRRIGPGLAGVRTLAQAVPLGPRDAWRDRRFAAADRGAGRRGGQRAGRPFPRAAVDPPPGRPPAARRHDAGLCQAVPGVLRRGVPHARHGRAR